MAEPRLQDVTVSPEQLDGLRWERLFGRSAPVEIEIGTGKAGYLLRRAQAHPEIDFLGIEWANKFYRYAADRMLRWGVTNVRMLRTDADHFIKVVCPRETVSILHIYHPDPWPKKRHHKRRLLQAPFVDAATACLVEGGQIRVQTDHAEYYQQIRAVLGAHPQLRECEFGDPDLLAEDGRLETNFEVKYRREGRRFHRIAVCKAPSGA